MLVPVPDITVATLNLFNRLGRWGERAPLLVEQLAELQPDVIGLQEVDLVIDQGNWLVHMVNSRLGPQEYQIRHVTSPGRLAFVLANAVMTRLPVLAHETLDLLAGERTAQRLRLRVDSSEFDFYNTHLHHPLEARDLRLEQARRLLAWMEERSGSRPLAAAGDFNGRPDEPAIAAMKERLRSAHESAQGSEPEKTWPTPVNTFDPDPPGCLDYIFVRGARVSECRLAFDRAHPHDPTLYPSDHLGLLARLSLA